MGTSILPKILLIWFLLCFDSAHLIDDTQTLQPPDAAPSTSGNHNLVGTSRAAPKVNLECDSSQEQLTSKVLCPLDVSKIEILAEDKSDPPKTLVCDLSTYTLEIVEGITATYKLNEGYGCVRVNYDAKEVWNLGPIRPYPKSLIFFINGSTMFVNFKYSRDILSFDGRQWKCIFSGIEELRLMNINFKDSFENYNCEQSDKVYTYTAKNNVLFNKVVTRSVIAAKLEVIWQTSNPFMVAYKVVYDESDPNNLVVKIYNVNGLTRTFSKKSFWTSRKSRTIPSSNELTADRVQITTHDQTNNGMILEEDDDYLKYSFEEGIQCATFEYDGKRVFTINTDEPQPECVYFTIRGNTVFLEFECHMIVVKLEGDEWKITFYGIIVEQELNIESKQSDGFYEYKKNGKLHTYTASWGHAFGSVYKGGSCLIPDAFVWNTWDYRDFITKVVYDETDSKYFILITYHLNGLKRILKKPKYPWEESLPKEKVYIRTGSKVVPLPPERDDSKPPTTDRFEPASETTESSIELPEGVVFAKDDHYLKYVFRDGLRCVGVRYDSKQVWKHKANDPFPISLFFTIRGTTAILNFENKMEIFNFSDDEWEMIYSGNGEVNLLDIRKRSPSAAYYYFLFGKVHTFIAKDNHLFCSVFKKGGDVKDFYEQIWHTDYFDDVANKVEYDKTNVMSLTVRIHCVSGTIRTFKRNSSGGRWEECDAKETKYEIKPEKVEILIEYEVAPPVREARAKEFEILDPYVHYETLASGRTHVDLDIRTRRCTEQFDYSESYKFWTYTAKDGCYFRSVSDSETEIWRNRTYCLSATKVIAELDTSSSLVGLTLHLLSGEAKRFNISNGELHEVPYKDPIVLRPFLESLLFDQSPNDLSQPSDGNKGSYVLQANSASSQLADASPSLRVHDALQPSDENPGLSAHAYDLCPEGCSTTINWTCHLTTGLTNEGLSLQP